MHWIFNEHSLISTSYTLTGNTEGYVVDVIVVRDMERLGVPPQNHIKKNDSSISNCILTVLGCAIAIVELFD